MCFYLFAVTVSVHDGKGMHAVGPMSRSEDNFVERILSFHLHEASGDGTWVTRLCD